MSLIPGMNQPIWPSGSTAPSAGVNTALERLAFLARGGVLSRTTNAEPGSPDDGDAYIMTAGRTGANWATYAENDVAVWLSGAWFVVKPAEIIGVPLLVNDEGDIIRWNGSAYEVVIGGGGGGATEYDIIPEASAFTATPATHAGLGKYIRAGGNVTFDSAQSYTAGQAFNIRATGAVTLVGTGVTLTAPSGGTLNLTAGMAVQVVMVTSTTADVIGQTVPA